MTAPAGTITSAKVRLGAGHPLSAWTDSAEQYTVALTSPTIVLVGASGEDAAEFEDNVERVACAAFTENEYGDSLPQTPIVMTGCCQSWAAFERPGVTWSIADLAARCSPDTLVSLDGGPEFARLSMCRGLVSLSEYQRYCEENADGDSAPLYVFDSGILLGDLKLEYGIPRCFTHDMAVATHTASTCRPLPPAWLLVGASRSGTPIHDHPTTAAWNSLLCGCKLWTIFPPDVDEDVLLLNLLDTAHASAEGEPEFDLSALQWFGRWSGLKLPACAQVIVQHPGETVFLPAGWWHVVLNVHTSTALSHSLMLRRDQGMLQSMLLKACEHDGDDDDERLKDLLGASGHLLLLAACTSVLTAAAAILGAAVTDVGMLEVLLGVCSFKGHSRCAQHLNDAAQKARNVR